MRLFPSLFFALGLAVSLAIARQQATNHTITTLLSVSADGDLTHAGAPAGEIGVNTFTVTWRSSVAISDVTRLSYGLDWERFDFDRPATFAVPDTLQEVAVMLGASHRFNPSWLLTGTMRPGLHGDFEGDNGDAFNAPLLLFATWMRSPEVAWAFGVRADWFSERAVMPLVGVNWKFAPGWEFSLGMPRAGLTYAASDMLKLTLSASVQGGNFHVARDPRPISLSGGPRLDDTKLDYHEIRVGLAADWRMSETFVLTAEAGVITDQKFDYFDHGITLDGGGIGFLTIGLSGRF